jgi:spore maturation protein CgeB
MAESPEQMHQSIRLLVEDKDMREELTGHALETIHRRHHCGLRAEQFETICESMLSHAG